MVEKRPLLRGGVALANGNSRSSRHLTALSRARVEFKLVGHGCPYATYPAPVIPIGMIGEKLAAVYPGGILGPTLVFIENESPYVHHNDSLRNRLREFDYHEDRLFAYSPEQVIKYQAAEERQFLRKLLDQEPTVCGPHIRRMLEQFAG
jgi:hypothetical protein